MTKPKEIPSFVVVDVWGDKIMTNTVCDTAEDARASARRSIDEWHDAGHSHGLRIYVMSESEFRDRGDLYA